MNARKQTSDTLYSFVMRGFMAEQALDALSSDRIAGTDYWTEDAIGRALSTSLLDSEFVERARRMSLVYTTIAAFENSVRDLVADVLLEEAGANWWVERVSSKIREKAEARRKDEEKFRWHGHRGDIPLEYTDFGDLGSVIQQNWSAFQPYVQSFGWVQNIFNTLERSRNVIMHSGDLDEADIDRIGIHIRDWVRQVG